MGDGRSDTVDPEEVARFSALAEEWWDPAGSFAPLHRLNPVRLAFLRDKLVAHFGCDPGARRPFEGLAMLDVGDHEHDIHVRVRGVEAVGD